MPVDTLSDTDRIANVLDLEIAVRYVIDVPATTSTGVTVVRETCYFALPGFDPGTVGRVDEVDVLVDDVVDEVWVSRVLTDAANWHAVGAVTGDVLRVDVGAVAFDGDAVVAAEVVRQYPKDLDRGGLYLPFYGPIVK